MKIRIQGNSVRFRLAQNEVNKLIAEGEVWAKCQFGTGELLYGLKVADVDSLTCVFQENRILAKVPKILCANWDTDERVGFENTTQDGLFVLVEKDWQCIKPRENEDETNLYVNPQA